MAHTTRETYDGNGNLINTETVDIPDDFAGDAQKALTTSDLVALRCVKAGITFPAEWRAYIVSLRGIVNGAEVPLPSQPDFPAGT